MGLVDIVEDSGGNVVGPFMTVNACMAEIDQRIPDIAILDLRLEDGESLGIAKTLVEKGVPIVFHSGHMVDHEWQDGEGTVLYCGKPCANSEMEEALLTAANHC